MIAKSRNTVKRRILASGCTAMALVLLAGLQSGRASEPASSSTLTEPPRILSSNPRLGETEVDPSLTEIRITFDRDMDQGFSWTGGPPDFPPTELILIMRPGFPRRERSPPSNGMNAFETIKTLTKLTSS